MKTIIGIVCTIALMLIFYNASTIVLFPMPAPVFLYLLGIACIVIVLCIFWNEAERLWDK